MHLKLQIQLWYCCPLKIKMEFQKITIIVAWLKFDSLSRVKYDESEVYFICSRPKRHSPLAEIISKRRHSQYVQSRWRVSLWLVTRAATLWEWDALEWLWKSADASSAGRKGLGRSRTQKSVLKTQKKQKKNSDALVQIIERFDARLSSLSFALNSQGFSIALCLRFSCSNYKCGALSFSRKWR